LGPFRVRVFLSHETPCHFHVLLLCAQIFTAYQSLSTPFFKSSFAFSRTSLSCSFLPAINVSVLKPATISLSYVISESRTTMRPLHRIYRGSLYIISVMTLVNQNNIRICAVIWTTMTRSGALYDLRLWNNCSRSCSMCITCSVEICPHGLSLLWKHGDARGMSWFSCT